jgi:tetratricopeptide (TPR) repeat protein
VVEGPARQSEEKRDGAEAPDGERSGSRARLAKVTDDAMMRAASPEANEEQALDAQTDEAFGDATQAGPLIWIAVIHGPDLGKRQRIRGSRMVVGRGEACDLRLTDGLVSRRHIELVSGPRGVVLRDLGSNNGTRVNGTRQVEVTLRHRDEVELGGTILSVVDQLKEFEERNAPKAPAPSAAPKDAVPEAPAAAEPNREASGPAHVPTGGRRRRRVLLGAASLALLALAVAAWVRLRPTPPIPGPMSPPGAFDQQFKTARDLLNAGKYAEALKAFEALAGRYPEAPQLNGHIELCKREQRSASAMLAARVQAQDGELEKAIAAARTIGSGTQHFGEAQQLIAQWTLAREKEQLDQFRAALGDGDLESARTLLESLPKDVQPSALEEIAQADERSRQQRAEELRRQKRGRLERQKEELRRTREEVDQAIAGVVRKIDLGNLAGAALELERVAESKSKPAVVDKLRLLKSKLPVFAESFRDGTSKYAAGELEDAAQPLMRALTAYEDMDLAGKLDFPLKQKAARALAGRGRAAAAREEWTAAGKDFRLALKTEPGLKEAADGLAALARRATNLYEGGSALMARDPGAARQHFEQVLLMTGSGDELHLKAQRRLEQLDRGRSQ